MPEPSSAVPDRSYPLRRRGRVLWLLVLPGVLYCLAPFVANRIEPRVFGIPFLVCYLLVVTALTGPIVGLVARFDPAYREGAAEFVPADDDSRDSA
ncbi:DUF3311 domain-containing protein [Nocardia wallacei]|uniref:DUF3311 domain-containing protein n=1 Tax=Nocardia wallacei TaxID=480035 RepID=A0A7G1KTL1_9NOCA|nr:DUF3311 domain-containing protein [Nocardia wallacei]BCK58547.1 hypothetical protein NWFMUON74_63190 [Nocardia wallacei]